MPSPPTERTIRILDFLTAHPGRGFTAAEISRRLKMSRGTTAAILGTLAAHGLLVRSPETYEYRLGPALIPIGSVAERSFPAVTHAKREAALLADTFDAECLLVMATGDDLLIVGRAGLPGPQSVAALEGQRQPLAPPLGSVLVAWAGDRAVEAWLDRLGPELTDDERDRYRVASRKIQDQGYAVAVRVPWLAEYARVHAQADLHTPEGRLEVRHAMAAVAHDEDYLPASDQLPPDAPLNSVSAPVFGPDGTMLFAIALVTTLHCARDIPELSQAVVRAAGRVMVEIDGKRPNPVEPPSPEKDR